MYRSVLTNKRDLIAWQSRVPTAASASIAFHALNIHDKATITCRHNVREMRHNVRRRRAKD
jgi:hypothetical protein